MNTRTLGVLAAAVLLQGCSTYMTPDGRMQTAVNPAAASVLETALGSGLGMATGALMENSPGWANGGVGGAVGSVGTQLVSALMQGARGQGTQYGGGQGYYPGPAPAPYYRARGGYPQAQYSQPAQYPQYPPHPHYAQEAGYVGYY